MISDSTYCRLCGDQTSETEATNILEQNAATLKFIIEVRLQIKIVPNGYHSNLVCFPCMNRLKDFHLFSKKCYRIQIQLAQTLIGENIEIKDEHNDDIKYALYCKNQNTVVTSLSRHLKEKKRPQVEITAENCDNIIIPESDEEIISAQDENMDETYCIQKKVPLSKLMNFFRSKMQPKQNNLDVFSEKKNQLKSPIIEDLFADNEMEVKSKYERRIPPRINPDDIKCPYCHWFILKEEFQEHVPLHIENPDDEFHKMIMAQFNKSSSEENTPIELKFYCTDCYESFNNRVFYEEHQYFHQNKKPIKCHLCDHTFINRKRLRCHLSSVHLERIFKCDQCSYRAKYKSDVHKHSIAVHTDARIMCPVCGKLIAAYPQNMSKHMDIHNEIPKYKCDLCPSAYRTKAGLKKHRDNQHFPVSVMCSLCGGLYASKQKYRKHMMKCKIRNDVTKYEYT